MTEDEKKQREASIIEHARRQSAFFPAGELRPRRGCDDGPDWEIPEASLGIEVTEVLSPKGQNRFSGAEVLGFQNKVVALAERDYRAQGGPPVDVLVILANDWNRKTDPQKIARALAAVVRRHLPIDRPIASLGTDELEDCPDVLSVRILRLAGVTDSWHVSTCAAIAPLRYEHLANCISAKNDLLPRYRARLPGWSIWLLVATDIQVLRTVEVAEDEVAKWQFAFDFDKVLLVTFVGQVIELHRTPQRQRILPRR